jgi:broad specificity phosphatase PhoE
MSPVFRKEQRHLTAEERQQINDLKQLAEDLHDLIDMLPASRARDIAQIRLEECVMWSVKAQSDAR